MLLPTTIKRQRREGLRRSHLLTCVAATRYPKIPSRYPGQNKMSFLHYCLHTAHNITINGHSRMLIQLYQQESNILSTILFKIMPGINHLGLGLWLRIDMIVICAHKIKKRTTTTRQLNSKQILKCQRLLHYYYHFINNTTIQYNNDDSKDNNCSYYLDDLC